jgi:hypothetical protein
MSKKSIISLKRVISTLEKEFPYLPKGLIGQVVHDIDHHFGMKNCAWASQPDVRISGTLGRNFSLRAKGSDNNGFSVGSHIIEERIASSGSYGYGFQLFPTTTKMGRPLSEGDSPPHVEIGKYIHKLSQHNRYGDIFRPAFLSYEDEEGTTIHALAIIVEHPNGKPAWVPEGYFLGAVVSVYGMNVNNRLGWSDTRNPC